jgi:CMD domain protein
MTASEEDVIDRLVGIAPGSPMDAIRARRPEARAQAQASWRALFAPADPGGFGTAERFAVAAFVAGLHGPSVAAEFYAARLTACGAPATLRDGVTAAIAEAHGNGPYGAYPPGPLSREDVDGPAYRACDAVRAGVGGKLAAAFQHAHMLVLHPRDASPADLQALLDAGWSTDDIVALSQMVAFLSFQLRVVAGLRAMAPLP